MQSSWKTSYPGFSAVYLAYRAQKLAFLVQLQTRLMSHFFLLSSYLKAILVNSKAHSYSFSWFLPPPNFLIFTQLFFKCTQCLAAALNTAQNINSEAEKMGCHAMTADPVNFHLFSSYQNNAFPPQFLQLPIDLMNCLPLAPELLQKLSPFVCMTPAGSISRAEYLIPDGAFVV